MHVVKGGVAFPGEGSCLNEMVFAPRKVGLKRQKRRLTVKITFFLFVAGNDSLAESHFFKRGELFINTCFCILLASTVWKDYRDFNYSALITAS